ncbi:MAG: D-alanyl-D-alanine carboxypeptidase family protein [Bacilli bacterium]
MKKFLILISILSIFTPLFTLAETLEENNNNQIKLIENAKSGILIDVNSGKVLYEKNPTEKLAEASLTKMMVQLIFLEYLESGKIKLTDKIKVSANAASFGGSQIYLEPNEEMSIEDLFKGVCVASANDATVAIAETIAGTEEEFVKMMNKKAKKLGLKNTNFVNSTGLDADNHYTTAKDLSILGRELLKHEQILEFSSIYEDYLREDTDNKFWLVNTNKLVRTYEGADGLKTGHTDNAGYCLAATAKRNGMRLLAIVLGESNSKVRNTETATLLDYGFNNYKLEVLQAKGTKVDTVTLDKADKENIDLVLKEDAAVFTKKTDKNKKYTTELKLNKIELPIKKGDVVGKVIIKYNGEEVSSAEVTVKNDIKKISLPGLYIRNLKELITGFI